MEDSPYWMSYENSGDSMSLFKNLKDAIIQKRTGRKALYNGMEIWGCSECGNNKEFPGLIPWVPTHKCIVTSSDKEELLTIFDPFNIPPECPLKITGEVK